MKTIGIQGLTGRAGGHLLALFDELASEFDPVAIVRTKKELPIVRPSGKVVPQVLLDELQQAAQPLSLIIDFSVPTATLQVAAYCRARGVPLLVATTGFSPEELKVLSDLAHGAFPLLRAPNTSVGVLALVELCKNARLMLGEDFDIEISEIHHSLKKDAPSGTAMLLADAIRSQDSSLRIVHDRSPLHAARDQDSLGITAIRGGSVVGEHTVFFIGKGERLELTHRAWDRSIFARGALSLGRILMTKPHGYYTVNRNFLAV